MIDVAWAYLVAALLAGCVMLAALLIASTIRDRVGARGRLALILIGMLLVGIAGLERMGWPVHRWQPGSPAQDFDDFMFRIVWLTGLGLLFIGGLIGFLQQRQVSPQEERDITAERKTLRMVK